MKSRVGVAHIGIAGAGVLGRLLAWQLTNAGHRVTVFDPATDGAACSSGQGAAAFTAAGMLSPLAEMETGGAEIASLGWRSMALWPGIAQRLNAAEGPPLFRQCGSLIVAHPSDRGAAERVLARLHVDGGDERLREGQHEGPLQAAPRALTASALAALEPALAPQLHGWHLPGEGQVLPGPMMVALWHGAPQAEWRWGTRVARVQPGRLTLVDGSVAHVDLAIDTRGLGARDGAEAGEVMRSLRGVRGELVHLHAPGLALQRPVRLLHPRHRVYLVPRPNEVIVLGASEVESEDRSPVSLRTAVELMAAAHSVLPALAEARIVHLETNLRPALPDHRPHTHAEPGLLRVNGLFRHGWLLAPALVEAAIAAVGLPAFSTPSMHATDATHHA